MAWISIGDLAKRSGVSSSTIRFYEEIGLLPVPQRGIHGHRQYCVEDECRLNFIRRCRKYGFSVSQTKMLSDIAHSAGKPCLEARDLALEQLSIIGRNLADLRAMEESLPLFVAECDARCSGVSGASCTVLQDLSRR